MFANWKCLNSHYVWIFPFPKYSPDFETPLDMVCLGQVYAFKEMTDLPFNRKKFPWNDLGCSNFVSPFGYIGFASID